MGIRLSIPSGQREPSCHLSPSRIQLISGTHFQKQVITLFPTPALNPLSTSALLPMLNGLLNMTLLPGNTISPSLSALSITGLHRQCHLKSSRNTSIERVKKNTGALNQKAKVCRQCRVFFPSLISELKHSTGSSVQVPLILHLPEVLN